MRNSLCLRLSKNFVFRTASRSKPRFRAKLKKNRAFQAHFFFPCIISEVHAPGFCEIASRFLFNARCRAMISLCDNGLSQQTAFLLRNAAVPELFAGGSGLLENDVVPVLRPSASLWYSGGICSAKSRRASSGMMLRRACLLICMVISFLWKVPPKRRHCTVAFYLSASRS